MTFPKAEMQQLLDALVQLRWLVEDRAPENAEAVLDAIWRTQVRLLADNGELPSTERSQLLSVLRTAAVPANHRLQRLAQTIEAILA